MTSQEFKEQMEYFASMGNTERKHIAMDNLMCEILEELGYGEGVKIFYESDKWYA